MFQFEHNRKSTSKKQNETELKRLAVLHEKSGTDSKVCEGGPVLEHHF